MVYLPIVLCPVYCSAGCSYWDGIRDAYGGGFVDQVKARHYAVKRSGLDNTR